MFGWASPLAKRAFLNSKSLLKKKIDLFVAFEVELLGFKKQKTILLILGEAQNLGISK